MQPDQIIPQHPPRVVQPSADKVDLHRLESDIEKFLRNSAVFDDRHKDWWHEFFDIKSREIFGHQDDPTSWFLDDLKQKKERQLIRPPAVARDTDPNSLASVSVAPDVHVPERVMNLVENHSNVIPQVYTGRYQNPQLRVGQVTEVTNHLESLQEGVFVAIAQSNSKPPIIGKVMEVAEENFKLWYWRGSWRKPWSPWKMRGNQPWIEEIPKSAILLTDFHLDANNKLQSGTSKYLKREYQKLL
ncbi:hypothetical protein QZH41_016112 [Actinostola sp. cb2023]|nr:hypothetical protein QZH41_016112 [Actinostola sp. cb2023]